MEKGWFGRAERYWGEMSLLRKRGTQVNRGWPGRTGQKEKLGALAGCLSFRRASGGQEQGSCRQKVVLQVRSLGE